MNVNSVNSFANVKFKGIDDANQVQADVKVGDIPNDSFEMSKLQKAELTKEDKQEIVRQAKTTAAGWSIFGGIFSTLYFALRSDKTVAKKYNLDPENDKKLIKNIKNQQMLWTIPGAIPGIGLAPSLVAWLYNKNSDASKIDV